MGLTGLDPNAPITIMSPLVGTLWHKYEMAGLLEEEAMKELVKIFEDAPELLFWSGRAADLIWSIYHFDEFGFKFNWGFMRNNSNQFYKLHTGHGDHIRMGEVQRWCRDPLPMSCLQNESTQYIDVWEPAMELRPGHLFFEGTYSLTEDKTDISPLWIDILFRNIYLDFNHTETFKGIELYKYGIELAPQMSNTSIFPPNSQFNQFGPSGILNSTAAYDGISIFLSMVLFYGSPDYMQNLTKMGVQEPGP